jgi:hypothetical protein
LRKAILVDIDDCILDITVRKAKIFSLILGKRFKREQVIGKKVVEFLREHVNENEILEYRKRFWEIAFCIDPLGIELLKHDKPVPYSRVVLKRLSKYFEIIYITNRLESMKDITINELKRYNFPNYYKAYFASDSYMLKDIKITRSDTLSKLPKEFDYICVIDDMPDNFPLYKSLEIPIIIGFMKYIVLDENLFKKNGASYVIKDWKDFPFETLALYS